MNCLSVHALILSYVIQNTEDVIHITNARHENNYVKKKFLFLCRYNDSCTKK